MLTAADRLYDKASGFALGAEDYLRSPSSSKSSFSASVRSIAGEPTTVHRSARSPACASTPLGARCTRTAGT